METTLDQATNPEEFLEAQVPFTETEVNFFPFFFSMFMWKAKQKLVRLWQSRLLHSLLNLVFNEISPDKHHYRNARNGLADGFDPQVQNQKNYWSSLTLQV